jgi:dipeptidyl aminopeptidase/acylaminoacyl peptidase
MRAVVVALAALAALFPAAVSARSIDFPDLRKIVSISEPQISPDGTRILFMRSVSDYSKDRRDSQLMLFDVKRRTMRPLTFDRRGVSSPRWSPDGTRIAFLAPAKHDEKSDEEDQIFVMRMDGGEAEKISDAAEGVDNFAWSPNSRTFAYITQDENPHKKQIEQHLDAFEVGDNDYLHQSEEMPAHLWTIAATGGKAHRLTSGSWSLETFDPTQASDISWSPDGSKIAVTHFPTPLVGDSLGTVIDIVDVRTGRRFCPRRKCNLVRPQHQGRCGERQRSVRHAPGRRCGRRRAREDRPQYGRRTLGAGWEVALAVRLGR